MIDEKKFSRLIKLASQPVKPLGKTKKPLGSAGRTDKRTRQRKRGDTLEKQHGKSR